MEYSGQYHVRIISLSLGFYDDPEWQSVPGDEEKGEIIKPWID